ncbi:UNKNOWN [Stylonychia lemnae]|uniref:Transmembrane protein n=1 Tax=Stylonychia lemnae TaxID=5949 RepID=A0A078AY44_STYLE|nr:UNKNOWN [Stylonychia lemnae]|eukprot:CDW85713.1 UNKNOWN [Stylonychia lemnae]
MPIVYIFKHRKHMGVINRSPWLILFGATGILTTVTNYYMAWVAIALRAYRLRKVFDCYNQHLAHLQQKQDRLDEMESTTELSFEAGDTDQQGIRVLKQLKEKNLIAWVMLIFILPNFILGIIAIFVPYVYVAIPIYETQQCMKYYGDSFFTDLLKINLSSTGYCAISVLNICTFIIVNWLQTLVLILLFYRLRNIKDELNIKQEIRIIIIIWISFSLAYFITLQYQQYHQDENNNATRVAIFCFILLRNIGSVSVSTYFCYFMVNNPVLSYSKPDYPTQLFDFEEAILESVLPYKYFRKFIEDEQPEQLPFLQILVSFKKLKTFNRALNNQEYNNTIEKEQLETERHQIYEEIYVTYKDNHYLFSQDTCDEIKQDNVIERSNSNKSSINADSITELEVEQLFNFSKIKLRQLYQRQFIGSELSKVLIQELSNSIIEFRFLQTAGLIN